MRVLLVAAAVVIAPKAHAREVAITFDDFDMSDTTLLDADQRNAMILQELARHGIKAALFVTCKNLKTPADWKRLQAWSDAGHLIGNHTFSHTYFGKKQSVQAETDDIAKCDAMLAKVKGFERRFRYPYLAEGDTPEKRDAVHAWLKQLGYRSGAVTIDTSEWYIDRRLRDRLAKDSTAGVGPLGAFYVRHMLDRADYYDGLAKEVLEREVKHTLLMHTNLITTLGLGDLLTTLERKGWKLIDAREAFKDPIFAAHVDVMPSGQSIVWAHAHKAGKDMRFPGEDGDYEKDAVDALNP